MQYFTRDGRQLDESEALKDGILKDGIVARTRLLMRDGVQHRPGFASGGTAFSDFAGRDAKREANEAYEDALVNAWRNPTTKLAELAHAAGDDEARRVERENDGDRRTIAEMIRDHRGVMDEIYAAHARDLENAWKR
jgi:hypothetical protein